MKLQIKTVLLSTALLVGGSVGSVSAEVPGVLQTIPQAWLAEMHEGAAVELSKGPDDSLLIDVTAAGAEGWHGQAQHFIDAGSLDLDATYTLKFDAKAEPARELWVVAQEDGGDYGNAGLDARAKADDSWATYEFAFKPTNANRLRLPSFLIGDQVGKVWLRNLSITKDEPVAGAEGDLLGGRLRLADWRLEEHEGGQAKASMDGDAIRVDVTAVGSEAWHAQIIRPGITLEEGKSYTLTFKAKADANRMIAVSSNLEGGDYRLMGLEFYPQITTQWAEYTSTFTATASGEARVPQLMLGDNVGTVWFKDVSLVAE